MAQLIAQAGTFENALSEWRDAAIFMKGGTGRRIAADLDCLRHARRTQSCTRSQNVNIMFIEVQLSFFSKTFPANAKKVAKCNHVSRVG
jgi:hypothetical protein